MARTASQADHEQRIAAGLEADLRQATGHMLELREPIERLEGGFDAETYGFRLRGAPIALSGNLVVRLFRGREGHRVRSEAAIQNQLARRYPTPRVPIDTAGRTIVGRPYVVMLRLPGKSLLHTVLAGSRAADAGALLGAAQARLHSLAASEAIPAGFDPAAWTPGRLLADLRHLAAATDDPDLNGLAVWLDQRSPAASASPSPCHGDFHPGNVLVENMRLTGVIDWTNFALARPEFDVAITRLILSIGLVAPWSFELRGHYDTAYRAVRTLDERLVRYYTVLRAARALARSVARSHRAHLCGAAPDGYAWSAPRVQAAIRVLIRDETGL